jgi:Mn-dependent DtxR family transcriptional regulator
MESTNGMDLTEDTNHGKIYQFLRERDSLAYTREEVSRLLNIPVGSVGPSLTRLKQEGLVEHQGQYWTIHQDETE